MYVCMYVYVCVCVCMYVCMCVCVCMYVVHIYTLETYLDNVICWKRCTQIMTKQFRRTTVCVYIDVCVFTCIYVYTCWTLYLSAHYVFMHDVCRYTYTLIYIRICKVRTLLCIMTVFFSSTKKQYLWIFVRKRWETSNWCILVQEFERKIVWGEEN